MQIPNLQFLSREVRRRAEASVKKTSFHLGAANYR
jgi:hypothetical protein